jgi:hypothetical protein
MRLGAPAAKQLPQRQNRKETPMFAGTPLLQAEANGVAPTLLFLLLVLTALGVIAHAAFI